MKEAAIHVSPVTAHVLLTSISDAARLLHPPRAVLRAGTIVGPDRRHRGCKPSAMLQAAWGASLRHVPAHPGHAGATGSRSNDDCFRSLKLPQLSRSNDCDADASARRDGRSGGGNCGRAGCTVCYCAPGGADSFRSFAHACRSRTSRNNSQLNSG